MEKFYKNKILYIKKKLENVIHPITVEKNRIGNKFLLPLKSMEFKKFQYYFKEQIIIILYKYSRISSWKVLQTSYKAHITSLQTTDEGSNRNIIMDKLNLK